MGYEGLGLVVSEAKVGKREEGRGKSNGNGKSNYGGSSLRSE